MTCALKLGLVISGRSSLIKCAVSFLGLRYHPLPVPLNSAERLTWRDAQPRCVERERKREMSHLQAGEAQHRPQEAALSPVAGRGWWVEWLRAHRGASLFKRRSLSHYQQSGGKTGTVRISHREMQKPSLFTEVVVLDFQIILIFRTCGLFLGANVHFLS